MSEPADYGSTTAVFVWVRKRVTPAMVWTIITTVIGAGILVERLRGDVAQSKQSVTEVKASLADGEKTIAQLQTQLDAANTRLAVIESRLATQTAETEKLRAWREDVASALSPRKRK